MRPTLLFAVLMLEVSAIGAPKVIMGTDVLKFREQFRENRLQVHRSGLMEGSRRAPSTNSRAQLPLSAYESELSSGKWMNLGTLPEFRVKTVLDKRSGGYMQKRIEHLQLPKKRWDGFDGKWEYYKEEDSSIVKEPWLVSKVSPDDLVPRANSFLDSLFPDMTPQVEFSNTETEYMNGMVKSVTLRYRRIFNGGIILGNSSYVELTFDRFSRICKVRVKWPEFEVLERDNEVLEPAEVIVLSDRLFGEVSNLDTETEKIPCDSVIVRGSALAWVERIEANSTLLTPVLSYGTTVACKEKRDYPFFNIALLKKLYK